MMAAIHIERNNGSFKGAHADDAVSIFGGIGPGAFTISAI
jgi:hypothetical protein